VLKPLQLGEKVMKKKVLMLAGLLSCLMMIFSVQADNDFGRSERLAEEKGRVINHYYHHTIVNVNPTIADMPGSGCQGRDLKLECPQAAIRGEKLDQCCTEYCSINECNLPK